MEFYQGKLYGVSVVIVKSGIGKVNAGICAQMLVDLFDVTAIINTGIAGSLNAKINIGDIVLSSDTLQHDVDATNFGYELGMIPGMDVSIFKASEELIEKAEAAAEKARNAVLNHERKELEQKKKKIAMPDKFKDCEKHGEDSMLIICEGNSALAGLMPARDVNTEALYAVRGKVKNLMKHPLEECLENQEVSDIILALGCGIQKKYNAKKLNFGKVAIAVDGDVDRKF